MDCVLPATGSDPLLVVLLDILVLGAGVALVLGVRRRGFGGGAAVVLAFALASAAVVVSDARRADAQDCPPSTTVAPTAAPTTVAVTTTAAATTTTTSSTTTTAATTTTTVAGGGVPTNPTFPTTTAATTTTVATPDLTPQLMCQTPITPDTEFLYTIRVRNVGSAPTDGQPMTFTVSLPVSVPVSGVVVEVDPGDVLLPAGWSPTITPGTVGPAGTPTTVTITSDSGTVILPNGSLVVLLLLAWPSANAGAFSVDVELPDGIGGEPSAANGNNLATCAVTVTPSGAQPTG